MMKTMKIAAVIAAIAAAPWTGATAEPVKIRMQFATPGQYVPIIPLAPPGIYRHYGKSYTVEPIFMTGSGRSLTALGASEIDLGAHGPQSISLGVTQGKLDMRAIVQIVSTDVPGWGAVEYWGREEITRIEDLKGRTIAVNSRGTGAEAAARIVLARHGLADGRDYQIVELRFPAILPALDSKRVDVGVLIQPFNSLAAKKPGLRRLFTMGDAFGPSETVSWAGKADWIAKNRATLVDFVEDHLRLRQWTLDTKTRPEALKLMAQVARQPVETLEPWMFTQRDNFRHPQGLIDVARFQKNVNDLHAAGVLPATIDAAKHIDTSIAREAAARLAK